MMMVSLVMALDKKFFRLVHKILKDKSTTGAWTTRGGDVIAEDYYVPVVSKQLFEQVQQGH